MTKTRDELEVEYDVDCDGRIRATGPFLGEMVYVPYFWFDAVDCGQVPADSPVLAVVVTATDRRLFPELASRRVVYLRVSRGEFAGSGE